MKLLAGILALAGICLSCGDKGSNTPSTPRATPRDILGNQYNELKNSSPLNVDEVRQKATLGVTGLVGAVFKPGKAPESFEKKKLESALPARVNVKFAEDGSSGIAEILVEESEDPFYARFTTRNDVSGMWVVIKPDPEVLGDDVNGSIELLIDPPAGQNDMFRPAQFSDQAIVKLQVSDVLQVQVEALSKTAPIAVKAVFHPTNISDAESRD